MKKPIRWFKVPNGIPAAFHNPSPPKVGTGSCVVCLNYKDHDKLVAGVEPWLMISNVVIIPFLSSDWMNESWGEVLNRGAQQMVDTAASADFGFKAGDFYGVFQICGGVYRDIGYVGLGYASSESPLVPVQGLLERELPSSADHVWITPQFAIPPQVDVSFSL